MDMTAIEKVLKMDEEVVMNQMQIRDLQDKNQRAKSEMVDILIKTNGQRFLSPNLGAMRRERYYMNKEKDKVLKALER